MRPLREDERDEIESVKHFIKYVNSNHEAEGFEVWAAMLKIQAISEKYILNGTATEEELAELLEIDDMKELLQKLMSHIKKFLKEQDGQLPGN